MCHTIQHNLQHCMSEWDAWTALQTKMHLNWNSFDSNKKLYKVLRKSEGMKIMGEMEGCVQIKTFYATCV